jgi:hypothetical protein
VVVTGKLKCEQADTAAQDANGSTVEILSKLFDPILAAHAKRNRLFRYWLSARNFWAIAEAIVPLSPVLLGKPRTAAALAELSVPLSPRIRAE